MSGPVITIAATLRSAGMSESGQHRVVFVEDGSDDDLITVAVSEDMVRACARHIYAEGAFRIQITCVAEPEKVKP